jgi:hypothetical protein
MQVLAIDTPNHQHQRHKSGHNVNNEGSLQFEEIKHLEDENEDYYNESDDEEEEES